MASKTYPLQFILACIFLFFIPDCQREKTSAQVIAVRPESTPYERQWVTRFSLSKPLSLSAVTGVVAHAQDNDLIAVEITNHLGAVLVSSEPRELQGNGTFVLTMPETHLVPGRYTCTATSPSHHFELSPSSPPRVNAGMTARATGWVWPIATQPYIVKADNAIEQIPDALVFGRDLDRLWPLGVHPTTRRVITSRDSGNHWESLMVLPFSGQERVADMLAFRGRIFLLAFSGRIFLSSGMSEFDTWREITCPEPLRRPFSLGRHLGFAIFEGFVFQGEYTSSDTSEVFSPASGPRILQYDIDRDHWEISGEFKARHVHSFFVDQHGDLWVSLGDAGWGPDIGIWHLPQDRAGHAFSWEKWTSPDPPHTAHYPVDFLIIDGKTGGNPGIYMASDRPGKQLLYTKLAGTPGQFNINAQVFSPPDADPGETIRALVFHESDGNLFYFSAETSHPALYVSPPPYQNSYLVSAFEKPPVLLRPVLCGDTLMIYNHRILLGKINLSKKQGQSCRPND